MLFQKVIGHPFMLCIKTLPDAPTNTESAHYLLYYNMVLRHCQETLKRRENL